MAFWADVESSEQRGVCAALLPAAVLVEVLERREQVVLPLHLVQVQRRRDELAVVDRATIIHVRLLEMGKIAAQIYLSGTAKIPFHSYFGF